MLPESEKYLDYISRCLIVSRPSFVREGEFSMMDLISLTNLWPLVSTTSSTLSLLSLSLGSVARCLQEEQNHYLWFFLHLFFGRLCCLLLVPTWGMLAPALTGRTWALGWPGGASGWWGSPARGCWCSPRTPGSPAGGRGRDRGQAAPETYHHLKIIQWDTYIVYLCAEVSSNDTTLTEFVSSLLIHEMINDSHQLYPNSWPWTLE